LRKGKITGKWRLDRKQVIGKKMKGGERGPGPNREKRTSAQVGVLGKGGSPNGPWVQLANEMVNWARRGRRKKSGLKKNRTLNGGEEEKESAGKVERGNL